MSNLIFLSFLDLLVSLQIVVGQKRAQQQDDKENKVSYECPVISYHTD